MIGPLPSNKGTVFMDPDVSVVVFWFTKYFLPVLKL